VGDSEESGEGAGEFLSDRCLPTCAVPPGLVRRSLSYPALEALGYDIPPLWGLDISREPRQRRVLSGLSR